MAKSPGSNWMASIELANLHKIFSPIFLRDGLSITQMNQLVCFVILAYDNESDWLNLKQDRYENKARIMRGLDVEEDDKIFDVIRNEDDEVNSVISEYVIEQVDWRWQTVFSLLDYHSKMIRFANEKTDTQKTTTENKGGEKVTTTEDYDPTVITKINKEKGELLVKAMNARQEADKLLVEMRKEYVNLDNAVQQDFNFSITDEKKIDIMSWSGFIRKKNATLA